MKLKITGFTDNTYTETKTIELDNVMSISLNAEDEILHVSYYENGEAKDAGYTSLQWAKGIEIT